MGGPDACCRLTNLIWGPDPRVLLALLRLLIDGGLTCPQPSISLCTPTMKASLLEPAGWCSRTQHSDRRFLMAVLGSRDGYFTFCIIAQLEMKGTKKPIAGCKLSFRIL